MKKNLFSLLFFLLSLSVFVGCQKEEIFVGEAPGIINLGVEGAETSIALTDKLEFKPELLNNPTKCEWSVNGELVTTQSSYVFEPKEAGRYTIKLFVENEIGSVSKSVDIIVKRHIGGFYIVNEGWFGQENGSVNYFDTQKETFSPNAFVAANPKLTLGVTTTFGAIWGDNFYFVSKQGAKMIVADAYSLKHKTTIDYVKGDGRSFAGIDSDKGVFTTSQGVFLVDLKHLCITKELETDGSECGDIVVTEKYIFVANSKNGLFVYDRSNYDRVKMLVDMLPGSHSNRVAGVVRSKDGNVWVGAKDAFIKINPELLTAEEVKLANLNVDVSWGFWHSASMVASAVENVIYYTFASNWISRDIYRYKIGETTSTEQPFAVSSDVTDVFSGKGFEENPATGDIISTYMQGGWGDNSKKNRLVLFDGKTGKEKKRYTGQQLGETFDRFWFPSMIVINE